MSNAFNEAQFRMWSFYLSVCNIHRQSKGARAIKCNMFQPKYKSYQAKLDYQIGVRMWIILNHFYVGIYAYS